MNAQAPATAIGRSAHRLASPLHSTDLLLIAFWGLLSLVSLLLHSRITFWREIIAANLAAAVLVWVLAWASRITESRVLRWVHDWAAFPLVIFTFEQLYYLIGPIHQGKDYDGLLIALDRQLFRVDPTVWLARFAHPLLTEALQIAYSLFYVLFLAVGFEFYRNADPSRFRYFRFTIVYGFLLSYAGYFLLPAVGPRFTLHDFSKIDGELPGLLLTPALRWFINAFESIPSGVSSAVAMAGAQRDVFPSGHTMMTIVALMFACRHRLKVRRCLLVLGTMLILATVYLRYHYVIDIMAGALLALPCLLSAGRVYSLFLQDAGSAAGYRSAERNHRGGTEKPGASAPGMNPPGSQP